MISNTIQIVAIPFVIIALSVGAAHLISEPFAKAHELEKQKYEAQYKKIDKDKIYLDQETGCQYILLENGTMIPRLNGSGGPLCLAN